MGQLVAEYSDAGRPTAGGTSYLTADTLGTPRVVTGGGGEVRARHDYLPFGGELTAGWGTRAETQGYVADGVRQQFTGYERDAETGLDYAQARYYASGVGRFTGVDPLLGSALTASPQTWNRYSYSLNNPLRYADPLGMNVQDRGTQDVQDQNKRLPPWEIPWQPCPNGVCTDEVTAPVTTTASAEMPVETGPVLALATTITMRPLIAVGAGAGASAGAPVVIAGTVCLVVFPAFVDLVNNPRLPPTTLRDGSISCTAGNQAQPPPLQRTVPLFPTPNQSRRRPLALGLTPYVYQLAAETGSETYTQAAGLRAFSVADFHRVTHSAPWIHFTLEGFSEEAFQRWYQTNQGSLDLIRGPNFTNYEYYYIRTNPSLEAKTTWHHVPASGLPRIP